MTEDDEMIPVRQYRRRKPQKYIYATPKLSRDEMSEIEKLRKEFDAGLIKDQEFLDKQADIQSRLDRTVETARQGVRETGMSVAAARENVKLKAVQRAEIEQQLTSALKAAKLGDQEAKVIAKKLKVELRASKVDLKRSKAGLRQEKGEAASAKQFAKSARIQTKVAREELKRARLATKLETVEKTRSIETSKEKLRQERVQRERVRHGERDKKRKLRKRSGHKFRLF